MTTQWYGSLTNRLNENVLVPGALKVGDGVTITAYSDRRAATVVSISPSGKTVKVQEDIAIRTDTNGMSESQDYRYERDPNGYVASFRWAPKRMRFHSKSGGLARGRDHHYDYSF